MDPSPISAPADGKTPAEPQTRSAPGLLAVLAAWLALALALVCLAAPNASTPGLYYDEAISAGMAKDFLTGHLRGQHLEGAAAIPLFGRPFPVFIQNYLGAVKCWLLLPVFALFGPTMAVLRWTNLACALVALLLFVLWLRRWRGVATAILAAAFLASDPSFFFDLVLDWGAVTPSLICRAAVFYLVFRWWQSGGWQTALLAGLFAGLGFFNKIDFAVLLLGGGVAALALYGPRVWSRMRSRPREFVAAGLGLLLTAGPMLLRLGQVWRNTRLDRIAGPGSDHAEKLQTLLAMYDGSYFYKLMNVGGRFSELGNSVAPVWTPLGVAVVAAAVFLLVRCGRKPSDELRRMAGFLLLSLFLITAGVFLLPGAVRIHHALLVFPFPHLVIALAVTLAWRQLAAPALRQRLLRGLLAGAVLLLLFTQARALVLTQRLLRETGGRGWWSDSLNAFCRQVKDSPGLTLVSLDWGFHEQILFLTEQPSATEPIWGLAQSDSTLFSRGTNCIYLIHPPAFTLFHSGLEAMNAARARSPDVEVKSYSDRESEVAFYAIRFRGGRASSQQAVLSIPKTADH